MSFYSSTLELRLCTEAAGVLVLLSTFLCLWYVLTLRRSGVFDTSKCAIYLLVAFPAVYGWLSLVYMGKYTARAGLALGMNISRCVVLVAFGIVIGKTLGKDMNTRTYSEGKMLAVLVSIETVPPWAVGLGGWSLGSVEEAKRFIGWMKAGTLQHVFILLCAGLAEILLEHAPQSDYLRFGEFQWTSGWVYLLILLMISATCCGYVLISLSNALQRCPDKRISALYTACTFTACITVAVEVQGLLLTVWGWDAGRESAQAQGFLGAVEAAGASFVQGWVWLPIYKSLCGSSTRIQTIRTLMEQRDFSQVELEVSGRGRN